MKKKNGFTLIELLVVIALMISLLGIAIVSFISVDKRKKQESWELVKEQIETAGKEYLTSNEYLFEGITGDLFGTISVKTLVENDYLTTVTNPITGKKVSDCSYVKITKENNKFIAKYEEGNEKDCDVNNSISIGETGGPDFSIEYENEEGKKISNDGDWFNAKDLGENKGVILKINTKTNGNGPISEVLINNNSAKKISDGVYSYNLNNQGKNENVKISVINTSGKQKNEYINVNIDSILPLFNYSYGYKVYNIASEAGGNYNPNAKTGITMGTQNNPFYNNSNYSDLLFNKYKTLSYIKWENLNNITDINKILVKFDKTKFSGTIQLGIFYKNDSKEYYCRLKGTDDLCTINRLNNNTLNYEINLKDSTKQISAIRFIFYGISEDDIKKLDAAGINIYSNSKTLYKNYYNIIRLQSSCSDNESKCTDSPIEYSYDQKNWNKLNIYQFSFETASNDGYFKKGKTYFRTLDNAGNYSNIKVIDTTNSFN